MKQLLVVFSYEKPVNSTNYGLFATKLAKYARGYQVKYGALNRMRFQVVDGKPSIYDETNKCDLASYDFVLFRTWEREVEKGRTAAMYLQSKKVPFVDSETNLAPVLTKLSQAFLFAINGIPTPDTLMASEADLYKYLGSKQTEFSWPLVAKANDASKGRHNYLVHSLAELKKTIAEQGPEDTREYLVQNFVPNDCDYRFLVFGYKVELVIKRQRPDDSTHLNNTSRGGKSELVPVESFEKAAIDMATKAARLTQREIAGVDVMINKETKEACIIEVNRGPQLVSGSNTEPKTKALAQYLETVIRKGSS